MCLNNVAMYDDAAEYFIWCVVGFNEQCIYQGRMNIMSDDPFQINDGAAIPIPIVL